MQMISVLELGLSPVETLQAHFLIQMEETSNNRVNPFHLGQLLQMLSSPYHPLVIRASGILTSTLKYYILEKIQCIKQFL